MDLLDLDLIPFVKARWFSTASNLPVKRIVVHDMETAETLTAAEAVANYFKTTSTKASAHYNVDTNSIVCSVRPEHVAYHAPPNTGSIGVEHAGRASQRREDWLDPYSLAELHLSAKLVRTLAHRYQVPVQYIDRDDLIQGAKGITTHHQVSLAWRRTDHTDPGPGFPMDLYLQFVLGEDGANDNQGPVTEENRPVVANKPFVAILVHPDGGYLQVGEDGGVFAWDCQFYGGTGGVKLNQPITCAAWTPTYKGYWLVAADGGVFAFGDAVFHGSAGGVKLNAPVTAVMGTKEGGYILQGRDGGVFPYGPGAKHRGNALYGG